LKNEQKEKSKKKNTQDLKSTDDSKGKVIWGVPQAANLYQQTLVTVDNVNALREMSLQGQTAGGGGWGDGIPC